MNVKIHSNELNRMMKTVVQCIDPRDDRRGNIRVTHKDNMLSVRGTNGTFFAEMSSPVLGGDGESFCVDGTMFARVCAMCGGEISLISDGKTCTVKGAGRTRLVIVETDIPESPEVDGECVEFKAEDFSGGYGAVSYAISNDNTRPVLGGVLIEMTGDGTNMAALDGFQMAVEPIPYTGDVRAVIPGAFMKLISQSIYNGETLKMTFSKGLVKAETDGMVLTGALLTGEFPDYNRILPKEFKTECLVKTEAVKSALKSGSVVNNSNHLVKMKVAENTLTVMSNSESAEFDADMECSTNGDPLTIAFNEKYLMNTIGAVGTESVVLKFNGANSPVIAQGKDGNGVRLVLPVRVMG